MTTSRRPTARLVAMATMASIVLVANCRAVRADTAACALVTVAEASAAMGVPAQPGVPRTTRHGSSCRFYSADHQHNVFAQTLRPDAMLGAAQVAGKAVRGVGERAIWAAGSLWVEKHGKVAQIGLFRAPGSMDRMDPQLVTLAQAVAARM